MSAEARLHIRAAVWGRADNRIAVLLLEGRGGTPLDPARLTATGLALITDLGRIALPTARAWQVRAEPASITVRWSHRVPLVDHAPVELPGVWRWAARRRGAVLVLLGKDLGVAEPEPARRALLARAAAAGSLAGGAVPFAEAR
ncbi:hypothetical protein AB0I60_19860 [Actinosynnema sp. NPDC050436]|uniref:hypothetical protein n=1 Tax=Actinosynnema sp. NPDC050436 TaxID=3155659 RepID=UPI0033DFB25B